MESTGGLAFGSLTETTLAQTAAEQYTRQSSYLGDSAIGSNGGVEQRPGRRVMRDRCGEAHHGQCPRDAGSAVLQVLVLLFAMEGGNQWAVSREQLVMYLQRLFKTFRLLPNHRITGRGLGALHRAAAQHNKRFSGTSGLVVADSKPGQMRTSSRASATPSAAPRVCSCAMTSASGAALPLRASRHSACTWGMLHGSSPL